MVLLNHNEATKGEMRWYQIAIYDKSGNVEHDQDELFPIDKVQYIGMAELIIG